MQNDLGKWKGKLIKVFMAVKVQIVSQKWPWNLRNCDMAMGSNWAD